MLRCLRLGVAALTVSIAAACGSPSSPNDQVGIPSCEGTAVFSTPPVDLTDVTGWVPLGQLGPPQHTFPTDHQYVYVKNTAPATVRSPGSIHVTSGRSSHYHQLQQTDYTLDFQPCAEIMGYFGHVNSLEPTIAAQLGPFDQFCSTYSPGPGFTVTQCSTRRVDVLVPPGEILGTTGGPTSGGLDFGLMDNRIAAHFAANTSRWQSVSNGFDRFHVVAGSDYFAEPARSAIAEKLGSHNLAIRRTIPPLGGRIDHDVAGTAQGAWFKPGLPTYPESPHLALVPDNIEPNYHVFSIGVSQPGPSTGAMKFLPTGSGTTNRGFGTIAPGSTIYCYEGLFPGLLLLRLESATSVTLERRSGPPTTCTAAEPLMFGATTVTYER
jgi:hypothetical protein